MVMRGGRGKEAGGTAFGNMGLDQELHLEVELGRTGPQMGSWAGSGPLVHHSLSISSRCAGALLEMWQNDGWGGWFSSTSCPRLQVEQMALASLPGWWAEQILNTLSYVSGWHQRARVSCGFETTQARSGLEPTVFRSCLRA